MILPRYEYFLCNCEKGDIILTKNGFGKVRSNKRKGNDRKAVYTSIKGCNKCGSTIDSHGTDLKKTLL
ncbi:hypothetical protein Metbo_1066 [Methanobacterium lacus]|jgi:hypothetical protein|uniref:DUF5679 domain-containing protein n=1 Tax=Methanobacterium lacus (strain AL-21) TaxID=877455 RepID=F0TCN5_METLA|nr:hypothetical protein [Methanobacterium lacus]ADZ09312.1 hypothetical protein Metbo_1066 [Methanobacterium lacus]UTB32894.1 MAG: hypothetical protein NKF70_01020 [Methanobacterium sp. ERen5]